MPTRLTRFSVTPIANTSSQPSRNALQTLADILAIYRKACTAAEHYHELKSLSDQALAEKGLARQDLPRVAFNKLVRETE